MVWPKGKPFSRKHRAKLSKARRGRVSNSKGYTYTSAQRIKLSEAHLGVTHTEATKNKLSQILRGRPSLHRGIALSPTHKSRIAAGRRRHLELDLPECRCWGHTQAESQLSQRMIKTFLGDFPEVVAEKDFGFYRVDAYLPPPYHLAFEADGDYWHRITEENKPGYYRRRDAYLLDKFNLPTVRLTESEINEA